MNKLNQNGWGLSVFIAFLGVFFIAIILIVYISNKYNVGIENQSLPKTSEKVNSTTQQDYQEYEKIIKEKAVIYQEERYPNISNGESLNTDIDNLNISSEIKEKCTGYVQFGKKNDIYYYYPYISCGLYRTKGYDIDLD